MQSFTPLATLSVRASAFAMVIALSACNIDGTVPTSTESGIAPVAAAVAAPVAAEANTPMSSVNIGPTINGIPATAAMVGAAYSFTPSATDVNSDALTFSIQNKPTWATFNPATGQLFGTPVSAGLATNVVISVSDGKATAGMVPFSVLVSAGGGTGGSAQVSWIAPTVNTDGSALTDLAGYHVYYGIDPSNLTRIDMQGAGTATYGTGNLAAGTYYFTVAAYNSAGVESAQPSVISTVIS